MSCLIQMQNKHRLIPITLAPTLPGQQTAQAQAGLSFPLPTHRWVTTSFVPLIPLSIEVQP